MSSSTKEPRNPLESRFALHEIGVQEDLTINQRLARAEEAIRPPFNKDVNELDPNTRTPGRPLHAALELDGDSYEMDKYVQWLLDHGADPRLTDHWGRSPLDQTKGMIKAGRGNAILERAVEMMEEAVRRLEGEERGGQQGMISNMKRWLGIS